MDEMLPEGTIVLVTCANGKPHCLSEHAMMAGAAMAWRSNLDVEHPSCAPHALTILPAVSCTLGYRADHAAP